MNVPIPRIIHSTEFCPNDNFKLKTVDDINIAPHPANAVRATQEYGDQEITYNRMTMRATFAIFHSLFNRWNFLIESLVIPPSSLILPTAL